uniref:Uncharacterized protein n=1 Tax=Physcomitrium patens TaxID=3218 RepID=A0A2K1KLG9_PHYPA|nr:hypothetical protein PHYPA_008290 [Physcomitrium patens]
MMISLSTTACRAILCEISLCLSISPCISLCVYVHTILCLSLPPRFSFDALSCTFSPSLHIQPFCASLSCCILAFLLVLACSSFPCAVQAPTFTPLYNSDESYLILLFSIDKDPLLHLAVLLSKRFFLHPGWKCVH